LILLKNAIQEIGITKGQKIMAINKIIIDKNLSSVEIRKSGLKNFNQLRPKWHVLIK
jgi:hypothetical protein